MKKLFLALILTIILTSQAFAAASIVPAFSKYSAAGGSVDAGKQGTNTMQVIGSTFSKPGGKPTMLIPGQAVDIRMSIGGQPGAVAGETDSLAPIVRAIAYAKLTYGTCVVCFPSGTWNKSDVVHIPAGIVLQGQGHLGSGGTLVNNTDSSKDGFIFDSDGYGNSFGGISNMRVEGARYGVYAYGVGSITLDNVTVRYCTVGYYAIQVINSRYNLLECSHNGTGAIVDYNINYYSDQSVWNLCKFNVNTGRGLYKKKGQGCTFVSMQAVGNSQEGLVLEDDTSSDTPLLAGTHVTSNDTFISPYIEGNLDAGLDTSTSLISIKGVLRPRLINAVIWNYHTKSGGVINISRSVGVRIDGVMSDASGMADPVVMDRLCLGCEVDIQSQTITSTPQSIIGGKVPSGYTVYPTAVSSLSNPTFTTAGAGGADVFGSWSETGATGQLSRDTSDVVVSGSSASLKVIQASPAQNVQVAQQTPTLSGGTQYYLNITYKTDTGNANINSPVRVALQNAGDSYKSYDFVTDAWSNSGMTSLRLPLSNVPFTVSLPFTSPATPSAVYCAVVFDTYSNDAANAIYHVYEVAISTSPNRPTPTVGLIPVTGGGTGSTTGSITGSTALVLAAGGTNQNVTLTPSGTGITVLNGNVGIGAVSATDKLIVGAANANVTIQQTDLTNAGGAGLSIKTTGGAAAAGNQLAVTFQDNGTTQGQLALRIGQMLRLGTVGAMPLQFYTNGSGNVRLAIDAAGNSVFSGTVAASGGSTNHAICWKASGVLGYCSAVVASDGTCGTCN